MEIDPLLITVLVPNYNHEKYLVQRLESIFNQTYTHYEVILMDDCSTDKSLEVLNRYKDHQKVSVCVFNETNTNNTFKQWMRGISLAKGDLIWIAETDDFCETNFLEELVKPFQNDNQIVLAYCQSNSVNQYGEVSGNWITHTNSLNSNMFLNNFTLEGNFFIEKFLIDRNVIPNASAVLFRKSSVDVNKHFDIAPEFKYCGDWMFYFKLIINNKIAFVSDSLNNFRYHSTSVIARAIQSENRITIIDIDFNMRKALMAYLSKQQVSNRINIKKKNNLIKRGYVYEKAILLIQTRKIIKGSFLLFSVFDIYLKRNNFKKRIKQKLKKICTSIFYK